MRARDFRLFVKSEPETGSPKIRARDALNQKSELDNLIKSNKSGYHTLSGFRNSQKLEPGVLLKLLTYSKAKFPTGRNYWITYHYLLARLVTYKLMIRLSGLSGLFLITPVGNISKA